MSEETTLHDKIHDDLKARAKWEERHAVWYRMRHTGIARAKKPYAGAPDLHYPLADTLLDKLKPFYYRQLFASELLGEFTPRRPQHEDYAKHAARWFDHQVKQETNLLSEVLYVIDNLLLGGIGICRPYWNAARKRIQHDSIDPLNFIVPPETTDLQEAGRIVHVEVLTRAQYAQRKGYNQDPEFIKRICGRGAQNDSKTRERELREGLNGTSDKDRIVIWNAWEGYKDHWVLRSLSPVDKDAVIQPDLKNPFAHGMAPFVDFPRELKEKGFYASRGEVEKVAQFERYLCKLWNKKGEALDFFATPLLTSDDPSAEAKNIVFSPGEFIPKGIRRVEWGEPPFALDQEMMNTRGIAEQRVGTPDFGMGGGNNLKDSRTATEITELANMGGITTELRAHVFRISLQKLLAMDWSLHVQYRQDELGYLFEQAPASMPRPALHDQYQIAVGGSAESWNKQMEVQKAQALFNTAKGDGYFDQLELRKVYTETLNPRWVKRLVRDPQQQANAEQQDEMIKVPALMEGMPIQPEPQQNHAVRAEVIYRKLQQLSQSRTPVDPIAQKSLVGYLNARMALWKQLDSKSATAWWKQKQQEMKAAQAQAQQQAGAPGNIVPFAQGGGQAMQPMAAGGMQ